jgi:hypothetical protein
LQRKPTVTEIGNNDAVSTFLAVSDESCGEKRAEAFYWGGFVAPASEWTDYFTPAWRERVLDGPPAIPFLHMTDIRDRGWTSRYGLSAMAAERRVDEAFRVIRSTGSLFPIAIKLDARVWNQEFNGLKITSDRRGVASFAYLPDHQCFLHFAALALGFVNRRHPDCDRLDFVVERNGRTTGRVAGFHSVLRKELEARGHGRLASKVGDFIPVGKESVPAQTADVLCWYEQRFGQGKLSSDDFARYATIATRKGHKEEISNDEIRVAAGRARALER